MSLKPPAAPNTPLNDNRVFVYLVGDHGAAGDGTTDDSSALQAALNAANAFGGGTVIGTPGDIYLAESVEVPSNVTLDLNGSTVKHKASSTTYCIRITGDDAAVVNGYVNGNSANLTADVVAVQVAGSRNRVEGLRVYDAEYYAIQVLPNATQISILNNWVYKVNAATACRALGIAVTSTDSSDPCTHVLVQGNHVRDTTMSGIGTSGVTKHTTFANNVTVDTGEDGIAAYDRDNFHLLAIGNNIYSPANNGIHLGGNHVSAIGNHVYDAAQRGITIQSDPNGAPTPSEDFVVTGNLVDTTANSQSGIRVEQYTGGTVSGNTVGDAALHGVLITSCTSVSVDGNSCRSNTSHGVNVTSSTEVSVTGNVLVDNDRGLVVAGTSADVAVVGNTIMGNTTSATRVQDSAARVNVADNIMRSNTTNFNFTSSDTTSSTVRHNLTDTSTTVASAATIALPHGEPFVTISGTADVTTITATNHKNHRVTLLFSGTAATNGLVDGSNLKLASTLAYTPNDTITLVCDGTDFYEVGRSVN